MSELMMMMKKIAIYRPIPMRVFRSPQNGDHMLALLHKSDVKQRFLMKIINDEGNLQTGLFLYTEPMKLHKWARLRCFGPTAPDVNGTSGKPDDDIT